MLSSALELTLRKALYIAASYRHEYATYEHLLLALMDDKDAKALLASKKTNIGAIRKKLTSYLEKGLTELVNENVKESRPTAGFQRIIQRAAMHSQARGGKSINGADLLTEFFFEGASYALTCLKQADLKRNDLTSYIKNSNSAQEKKSGSSLSRLPLDRRNPEGLQSNDLMISHRVKPDQKIRKKLPDEVPLSTPATELEKYCVNLNAKADEEDIDCLIGRHNEIQRTIEILCRRKKNNAILVGEPGVGKTAIAEGLATRIVAGDVPDILKDAVIYALDVGNLVAGTKFRGDFEERVKLMLECLKKMKNAILFIDEIHSIIGAGSTNNGALDASNLLKPALANGTLKCIGSTTFKEYTNHFEKDMALVRRFQKIVIEEPSEEASLNILGGLKGYYEKHHNVTYTEEALKAAITLSERYINDRHLPDKAIDLIDEAGARSKIKDSSDRRAIITEKEIESVVASVLNVPGLKLGINDIQQIKELEGKLKNSVFGQNEAIERLCASIKLSKAGLKKVSRPIGCYLFVGSTGVGKTELARQIAFFCNMKLLKFDMSEFAESSSISKLLGSAPGYTGFDQGGMLTGKVDKYPYSVVLFDEIEKAHPDIYNLLLQVMDEGILTDSTGKGVGFSNCIIILTSNISVQKVKHSIGFGESSEPKVVDKFDMGAINAEFSPEFRDRLDKIILFNPIDEIIDKIVSKKMKELASQLADRKIRLSVTSAVKKYFTEKCANNIEGARSLDRTIDIEIKQYIADSILFGKLKNGGVVEVDYSQKEKKITFKFTGIKKNPSRRELETN